MELHWLVDGSHPGAENMARDGALLARAECAGEGAPALLRVYGWDPPAVSLGYHQSEEAIDLEACAALGVDVVRRPTGGAAVLHAEEITWSVAARLGTPGFGPGVRSVYDSVADALVETLVGLGVPATRARGGRPMGFACFASAGGHEIVVDGRKLVGSALRRGRGAFLVHGSLLTGPFHRRLATLLRSEAVNEDVQREAIRLAAETVDLSALRVQIRAESFAASFAQALVRRSGAHPVRRMAWPFAIERPREP